MSPADPLPVLSGAEQRELLAAARLMRSLFSDAGGADADAALEGMRERFAALLNAGEPGDTASGRTDGAGCGAAAGRGEHRTGTAAPPGTPGAEGPEQAASAGTVTQPEAKPFCQGELL